MKQTVNMISHKDLMLKHKLVLVLIAKVKSAKTIYNISQTTSLLLGNYIENILTILEDLIELNLIQVSNLQDSPSVYKITNEGRELVIMNEDAYKLEVLSIIKKKELFLKIC